MPGTSNRERPTEYHDELYLPSQLRNGSDLDRAYSEGESRSIITLLRHRYVSIRLELNVTTAYRPVCLHGQRAILRQRLAQTTIFFYFCVECSIQYTEFNLISFLKVDFKERAAGVNGRRADTHGKPKYTGRDTEVKEGERAGGGDPVQKTGRGTEVKKRGLLCSGSMSLSKNVASAAGGDSMAAENYLLGRWATENGDKIPALYLDRLWAS